MEITIYILFIILMLGNVFQYYKTKKYKKEYNDLNKEINLYRSILETMPVAVFMHNKLKFEFVNREGLKVFGLDSKDQVIGKTLDDLIEVNMSVVGEERMKNALYNKPFEPIVEEYLTSKDGKVIAVDLISMPMELEGETVVLNVSSDINRRKQLEKLKIKVKEEEKRLKEALEHDKLKTEFFSNLSHELRTPLTLILGIINILDKELQENKIENKTINIDNKIRILKQNCYRLLRLVNNLIDITKLDAGYFELELEEENIVSVVEDITMSCVEYIENKGLEIEFDTEVEEKIIACDPEKIERIVLNLLSNSIKFTPKGGKITVNLFDKEDEIIISIKDTGIGMPKEKIDVIFDRFIQVDKSFTRSHEGSGIGLSLVKSLVEMHGGSISVGSEYEKGSEFIIRFPVKCLSETDKYEKEINMFKEEEKNEGSVERINVEFSDIYN